MIFVEVPDDDRPAEIQLAEIRRFFDSLGGCTFDRKRVIEILVNQERQEEYDIEL
jgi:hypothetical protein